MVYADVVDIGHGVKVALCRSPFKGCRLAKQGEVIYLLYSSE